MRWVRSCGNPRTHVGRAAGRAALSPPAGRWRRRCGHPEIPRHGVPSPLQMRSRPGTRASPGPGPPHSLLAGRRDPQASSLPPRPLGSHAGLGFTARVADAPGSPEEAREAAAPYPRALLARPRGDAPLSGPECGRRVGVGHPARPAQRPARSPQPRSLRRLRSGWPRALAIFSRALHLPTCKSSPHSQTRFAGFVPQVANLTHTE